MAEAKLSAAKKVGQFLRLRREQLSPENVGIPRGERRRTPGLRREEVAQLSFVSTTWYTWLEQGRGITVSVRSLSRIASALQLSQAERDYLFSLAELTDPLTPLPLATDVGVTAVVNSMIIPCYVMDATWQLVAWNDAAAELFIGWLDVEAEPNMLEFMFINPLARERVVDWPQRAQRIVAELRAESIHYGDYAPLTAMIARLMQSSIEFAEWWQKYRVVQREGGQRSFNHPQRGLIHYQQTSWQRVPDTSMKLVTLIAIDETTKL
ncbi:helix-turn-helix domain-containing protein [Rosenbergiella australiborealis]|uniref:Helix-turn-helix domain-containing protein n=1 Tax=Rosenbergiella australiborealis TaxID=1544696 RepID=A0ABS5T4A8_9GAMM|nr:helix-turn-helix transcriptional regulator [Rosenbergiella australiborealis]MBT0727194.1 helix-turn-helix domain-containing protein [Rosenbergiella australiborealis]